MIPEYARRRAPNCTGVALAVIVADVNFAPFCRKQMTTMTKTMTMTMTMTKTLTKEETKKNKTAESIKKPKKMPHNCAGTGNRTRATCIVGLWVAETRAEPWQPLHATYLA